MDRIEVRYWQVYEPDGGGGEFRGPCATSSAVAEGIAREIERRGGWGRCRVVEVEDSWCIFESVEEYIEHTSEEGIKKAALAKLTDKEKKALGF